MGVNSSERDARKDTQKEGEQMMKYPNLVWAIDKRRLAHYEVSAQVKIERTRFSRCLHGLSEFAPHEMARIGEVLGFSADWLFVEPRPPKPRMFEGETTPAMA
jgi:hypothetical protein